MVFIILITCYTVLLFVFVKYHFYCLDYFGIIHSTLIGIYTSLHCNIAGGKYLYSWLAFLLICLSIWFTIFIFIEMTYLFVYIVIKIKYKNNIIKNTMLAAVPWCYFYFLCLFGFLTHICQYKGLLCDCDKSESFIKLYSHVLSTTTYIFTFSLEFSSGYFCDYTLYCFFKTFYEGFFVSILSNF